MGREFRASPNSDNITWGDLTIFDKSAITVSLWAYVIAFRSNDESVVRKNGTIIPMQRNGSELRYRVAHWVNGSLQFNTTFYPNSTTGQWQHYLVRWESGGPFQPYLDNVLGTASANRTGTLTNSSNTFILGEAENDSEQCNARLAEIGVWDRRLSDEEKNMLASGFAPSFIPSNLLFYAPLKGLNSPEPDVIGSAEGTVNGAIACDHPNIIYPEFNVTLV